MSGRLGFPVAPMKATLGVLPEGDGWAYEIKWDGYRTLAHLGGSTCHLQSTAGRDVSARWPELGGLAAGVNAQSAIVDGELVVLDDEGRPRFELIQQRGADRRGAMLYVFDVLSVNGTDTNGLPYIDRRRLLDQLVEPGDNWLVPAHRVGDGAALLEATAGQGLEGVVAKRLDSVYRPGTRSKAWRKVKNRRRVTVTIGGFTAGHGNRTATFGALLVGRRDQGRLAFAGGVGTGFSQATLEELIARLRSLVTDECPFDPPPPTAYRRGATWVRPELAATIEIAEFTNEGFVRHGTYIELGDDPA